MSISRWELVRTFSNNLFHTFSFFSGYLWLIVKITYLNPGYETSRRWVPDGESHIFSLYSLCHSYWFSLISIRKVRCLDNLLGKVQARDHEMSRNMFLVVFHNFIYLHIYIIVSACSICSRPLTNFLGI